MENKKSADEILPVVFYFDKEMARYCRSEVEPNKYPEKYAKFITLSAHEWVLFHKEKQMNDRIEAALKSEQHAYKTRMEIMSAVEKKEKQMTEKIQGLVDFIRSLSPADYPSKIRERRLEILKAFEGVDR